MPNPRLPVKVIDMIFVFYGYIDLGGDHLYLVGCLNMIVWTHAVWGVLCACVLIFLYLHLFSAIEHVTHEKGALEIQSLL